MTVVEFLAHCKKNTLPSHSLGGVLYFYGSHYQPLFFQHVLSLLHRQGQQIISLGQEESDLDLIVQQRLASFHIGEPLFLWLGDLDRLENKTRKIIFKIAQSYEGLHHIGFFSSILPSEDFQKSGNNGVLVSLNELIKKQECYDIWQALSRYSDEQNWMRAVINQLYSAKVALPLETVCSVIRYIIPLKKDGLHYIHKWRDLLLPENTSLYTLAGYLFAKQPKKFFAYWRSISSHYSDQFWLVFWSEQFFKAYWFKYYVEKNDGMRAKKNGVRLPFSFLNKDHRLATLDELIVVHDHLYLLDWNLKNGQTFGLEPIFLNFMLNRLKVGKGHL